MKKLFLFGVVFAAAAVQAQQPQPQAAQGSVHQRLAPVDLTGTWVSVVTEDWEYRMIVPPKGDFASLPLTRAAQDAANRIDMAQVEAAGRACEAYGAPVIMREPGRVRMSWQDADTLQVETDSGQQTRLFHFDADPRQAGQPSIQGFSSAEWQYAGGFSPDRPAGTRGVGGRGTPFVAAPIGGKLKVTTTNLRAGFLRKNGVPYSANAEVTEYFNVITEPMGQQWLIVTTVVHDPENLVVDWITSSNFRKEPNAAGWRPRPCTLR